jgi:multidrug efflux pump subunit AcrA (membrane-fusion protein)
VLFVDNNQPQFRHGGKYRHARPEQHIRLPALHPHPGAQPLAIGQPVQVVARTGAQREGFAVPRSALVRERSGENVVWVHEDAERFVARRVAFESLDADTIVVSSGLSAGDRVVVSAANLLAQVR